MPVLIFQKHFTIKILWIQVFLFLSFFFPVVYTFNMTLPAFKYAFINGLSKEALRINCTFYTLRHCLVSSCTRMQSV